MDDPVDPDKDECISNPLPVCHDIIRIKADAPCRDALPTSANFTSCMSIPALGYIVTTSEGLCIAAVYHSSAEGVGEPSGPAFTRMADIDASQSASLGSAWCPQRGLLAILHSCRKVSLLAPRSAERVAMDPTRPFELVASMDLPLTQYDRPGRHALYQSWLTSLYSINKDTWATPNQAGVIFLWRFPDFHPTLVTALRDHTDIVTSIVMAHKFMISASLNGSVCIYDSSDFSRIAKLADHATSVLSLAYAANVNLLISCGCSTDILTWSIDPECFRGKQGVLRGHSSNLKSVAAVRNCALSLDESMELRVWDLINGDCVQTLRHSSTFPVRRIVYLAEVDKFCIAGRRLYFYSISTTQTGTTRQVQHVMTARVPQSRLPDLPWKMKSPSVGTKVQSTHFEIPNPTFVDFKCVRLLSQLPATSGEREKLVVDFEAMASDVHEGKDPSAFGIDITRTDIHKQRTWEQAAAVQDKPVLETYIALLYSWLYSIRTCTHSPNLTTMGSI